jgi:hypothetical protein
MKNSRSTWLLAAISVGSLGFAACGDFTDAGSILAPSEAAFSVSAQTFPAHPNAITGCLIDGVQFKTATIKEGDPELRLPITFTGGNGSGAMVYFRLDNTKKDLTPENWLADRFDLLDAPLDPQGSWWDEDYDVASPTVPAGTYGEYSMWDWGDPADGAFPVTRVFSFYNALVNEGGTPFQGETLLCSLTVTAESDGGGDDVEYTDSYWDRVIPGGFATGRGLYFQGVERFSTKVSEATDAYYTQNDAYDADNGRIQIDGASLDFDAGQCRIAGATAENSVTTTTIDGISRTDPAWVGDEMILTCQRSIERNGDSFNARAVRTFQGNWVKWELYLTRTSGTYDSSGVPAYIPWDYGFDGGTVFHPSLPTSSTQWWVADRDGDTDASFGKPILYHHWSAARPGAVSDASVGSGNGRINFDVPLDGTLAFTVMNAISGYPKNNADKKILRDCMLKLTPEDFGSFIDFEACQPPLPVIATTGGGTYSVSGTSVSFGHTVQMTGARNRNGSSTTTYTGQLQWSVSNTWRFNGTVSSTTTTGPAGVIIAGAEPAFVGVACPAGVGAEGSNAACARFSGTGTLEQYNRSRKRWEAVGDPRTFTATVYDGGTTSVCRRGSCSTVDVADWFGLALDGSLPGGVPVSEPQKLTKSLNGGIVVRVSQPR